MYRKINLSVRVCLPSVFGGASGTEKQTPWWSKARIVLS